jgi:RND family efflux transporter MFP subunit
MGFRENILRVSIVLIFLAGIFLAGQIIIKREKAKQSKIPKFKLEPVTVRTAKAKNGSLILSHDYLTVAEPLQTVNISSRIMARVKKVYHQEGDFVKQGDLLVTLDCRQTLDSIGIIEAQEKQAKAEYAANEAMVKSLKKTVLYWEKKYERDCLLVQKGTASVAESEATAEKFNEAQAKLLTTTQRSIAIKQQVNSLQRKLDELRTVLSYCSIISPFSGVITGKMVETGDMATIGKTLLVVEDQSFFKLVFDIPQADLPAVKAGLEVEYQLDKEPHKAVISRIYPSLNRARMARAEVIVPAKNALGVKLGAYLNTTVQFKRFENSTLIPVSALIETVEGYAVFIVKDGMLEYRRIKVQGVAREQAAVSDLEAGDKVVLNSFMGWAQLSNGMKIEIKK